MPFLKIYAVKCDINDKELERAEIGKYLHDGYSPVRMDSNQYVKCFDETMKKLFDMRNSHVGDYLTIEIEGGYRPHHVQMVNNDEMIVFWKRGMKA